MKYRVIAFFLILLLLTVPFATGVFAAPGDGDEPAETVSEETAQSPTQPPETEPAQPPVTEPAVTEAPATEPAVTEPVVTEPAVTEPPKTEPAETEPPETEPPVETTEPAPEPVPAADSCALVISLEHKVEDEDLLFTVRSGDLTLRLVIPAGESSVKVVGLKPGACTVTLETDWNWRCDTESEETLVRELTLYSGWTEYESFRFVRGESQWLGGTARGDGT